MTAAPALSATPRIVARPRALVIWHVGWAIATATLAMAMIGGLRGLSPVDPLTGVSLVVIVLPGVMGVTLLRRDDGSIRALLLALWALAAMSASALTGGLTGSLAAAAFLPLVAGLALGDGRLAQMGAVSTGLSILIGLVSTRLVGPGVETPALAAVFGLMVAFTAAGALHVGRRRHTGAADGAEGAVSRIEAILAAQPGLTLMIEKGGRVIAAYGTPPPGFSTTALFEEGLDASIHVSDRPAVAEALGRARTGPGRQTTQLMVVPRGALDRRVALFMARMDEMSSPGDRLIVQVFDGTAQFAREAELLSARAEAEAANAGKSRFLANMSHELRTPLNAVIGFSDIMRQRLFGPLPAKYADYAQSIHEAGGHLLALINDVLDVSKIEADRYDLAIERFDARDVITAALALVRVSADDKGVSLTGLLPPDLAMVEADRRALKQMTLNLLSNAVKFTPTGGTVTVTAEAVGQTLEIVVADTGVGIAPQDLTRLGRPYEQAGGADQKAQGTGLGLSLVRALAELHGGAMTMDSTVGEGTAVTLRLPVLADVEASEPADPIAST